MRSFVSHVYNIQMLLQKAAGAVTLVCLSRVQYTLVKQALLQNAAAAAAAAAACITADHVRRHCITP
jgi:hypothetical protein